MRLFSDFIPKTILILAVLAVHGSSIAQVEHNFKKGPENTDCHTLKTPFDSEKTGVELIEASSYRFVQEVTISKYKIPKVVYYYSCDGEIGYLVAEESEGVKKLYLEVPKSLWDDFIKDEDPIGFYKDKITPLKK